VHSHLIPSRASACRADAAGPAGGIGVRQDANRLRTAAFRDGWSAEHGIEGDRYETGRNGPRQVALIASEDIRLSPRFLGMPKSHRAFCVVTW